MIYDPAKCVYYYIYGASTEGSHSLLNDTSLGQHRLVCKRKFRSVTCNGNCARAMYTDLASCLLRRKSEKHMFPHFELVHSVHSLFVKHLFNYTNEMRYIYSLLTFIVFLLHVAAFDRLFFQSDVTVSVQNTAVPLKSIVFYSTYIDMTYTTFCIYVFITSLFFSLKQ